MKLEAVLLLSVTLFVSSAHSRQLLADPPGTRVERVINDLGVRATAPTPEVLTEVDLLKAPSVETGEPRMRSDGLQPQEAPAAGPAQEAGEDVNARGTFPGFSTPTGSYAPTAELLPHNASSVMVTAQPPSPLLPRPADPNRRIPNPRNTTQLKPPGKSPPPPPPVGQAEIADTLWDDHSVEEEETDMESILEDDLQARTPLKTVGDGGLLAPFLPYSSVIVVALVALALGAVVVFWSRRRALQPAHLASVELGPRYTEVKAGVQTTPVNWETSDRDWQDVPATRSGGPSSKAKPPADWDDKW
ncbi:hypothetical protein ACKKBF_B36990 [Auxenochlorella protothecoides x Auxenochlorella symbiontica]